MRSCSNSPNPAHGASDPRAIGASRHAFTARLSLACIALAGALLSLVAATSGALAVAACASGAAIAGLSHVLMARGLRSLLNVAGDRSARPAAAAAIGFVARHALVAVALFVLLVGARMPAGWVLAGVSALPLGAALAGLVAASPTVVPRWARGED